jgi:hypothetical protein
MQMGWGGVVAWTPEAKVKIAQATKRSADDSKSTGRPPTACGMG